MNKDNSSVVKEVKKNMRFVEKILKKFGDEVLLEATPFSEYLFSFVDKNGAVVDVRKFLDKIVITLPMHDGGLKVEYDENLLDRLIKKKNNEYIVVIDREDELKVDVMTGEDIAFRVSIGLVALKSEGLIVLTDEYDCE
jgi:hypothetical protein